MYELVGGIIGFIVAAVCGIYAIPLLKRLKFGQEIREEGPNWHQKKSGTPTMGGFIFIIGIVASLIVMTVTALVTGVTEIDLRGVALLVIIMLAFGAIGFIDDYIKVILKRNLGLTAGQKFGLQILVSVAFVAFAVFADFITTTVHIPFTEIYWNMGPWAFIPFTVLVMLASVNSVNLTDGLDGLATCVTIVVAIFFLAFSKTMENATVALFSATVIGGLLGFLIYNKFPAKVFMGDTGSLALGGAVCGMAILMEEPLALLVVGFVYVMETLSVIIQVTSYKLTKKRVFKMSPIHHHFEMCGWSERKIVVVFSTITAVLCLLIYFLG